MKTTSDAPPPGDDLSEYLKGGSELSRAYRQESAPSPPHLLDKRVLALSQGTRGASPCLAPLALAASVLLSVALVLAMVFGPQAGRRRDEGPRLIRVVARADATANHSLAEQLKFYNTEAPPQPARWLADISALRRAGREREADAELQRFRRAYPDFPIPEAPPP